MKIVYTILFFASTLAIVLIAFLLLDLIDTNIDSITFVLLMLGIFFSTFFLAFGLLRYFKLPVANKTNKM